MPKQEREHRINQHRVLVAGDMGERDSRGLSLLEIYDLISDRQVEAWRNLSAAVTRMSIGQRLPKDNYGYTPSLHAPRYIKGYETSLAEAHTAWLELVWLHGRTDLVNKILGREPGGQ